MRSRREKNENAFFGMRAVAKMKGREAKGDRGGGEGQSETQAGGDEEGKLTGGAGSPR